MRNFKIDILKKTAGAFILVLLVQTFFALFILNLEKRHNFGLSHILALLNYLVLMLVYIYFKKAKGKTDFLMYLCIFTFVILFSYFIYNKITF